MARRHGISRSQIYQWRRASKKSIKHMVDTIHELTVRQGTWQETTELVGKPNATAPHPDSTKKRL